MPNIFVVFEILNKIMSKGKMIKIKKEKGSK